MANTPPADGALIDGLLDKFVGTWRITRKFASRKVENDAIVTWELAHRYLRIAMKDVADPPMYEAHVYIGYERPLSRYVVHWMDVTSGSVAEQLGYGTKQGDSLVLEWKDDGGTLRNTFTWNPNADTWTSDIRQTGPDGEWQTFCVDTYRRA
jgi:hypothetical protein